MRTSVRGSVCQIPDRDGVKVDKDSTEAVWRLQFYVGKKLHPTQPGRLIYDRRYERFRGTEAQAKKRLRQLSHEISSNLDRGIPIPSGRLTVADLLRAWLDSKTDCAPKTVESYEQIVNSHLMPALGHIQLAKLRPEAIQAFYKAAEDKPLSARSVHYIHRLLKQALKYAVWQEYIAINPCERVRPPSQSKREKRTLAPAEVQALMKAAEGSRYYSLIYSAVSSGLRRNELLAVRWRDVDVESACPTIRVARTLYKSKGVIEYRSPKTDRSRRCISITQKLAAYLREHRADRESLGLHLGRLLSLDDLVFSDDDGRPLDPHVVSHAFSKIAKRAGLSGLRFHDLRHTFATLMLKSGAKPKVVSDALGHASVAFTMDTYADTIPQEEDMARLNAVLPEG